MRALSISTPLALLLVALSACSSGDPVGTGGTGGTGGSGGSGGTGGATATTLRSGFISMDSTLVDNGSGPTPHHNVSAEFAEAHITGPLLLPRTDTEVGNCRLLVCTPSSQPPSVETSPMSAGTITLSTPLTSLTLVPKADATYDTLSGFGSLWAPGDTVDVQVSGGEVPAFSTSVVAPSPVNVTAPALDPATPLTIDTTKDLAISWAGSSVGEVIAGVSTYSASEVAVLNCKFDPAAGHGVLPASLLGLLPKSGSAACGVQQRSSTSLDAGEFSISVSVSIESMSQGKSAHAGGVTLK